MTSRRWALLAFAVVSMSAASGASAQQRNASGSNAFAVETVGATAGSVAGVVLGLAVSRPDRCGVDDLACTIRGLGVAGVGSVIGSTAGAVIAGRSRDTRPSSVGAFVGAVAGAFAGVGLVHALTEEVNLKLEKPLTVAVYSLAQGVVTALGSRLGASIR